MEKLKLAAGMTGEQKRYAVGISDRDSYISGDHSGR